MDEGMKADDAGDRFISSETGKIVSEEFAGQNEDTTYLRKNFVGGKLAEPSDVDPRLTPIIQALEGMLNEPEDYNVAEFANDAHGMVTDLYRQVMRNRER